MSAAKFNSGDRVICSGYDDIPSGARGTVLEDDDRMPYIQFDTAHGGTYGITADLQGAFDDDAVVAHDNAYAVPEEYLEPELPEIKGAPEAEVIPLPRETDTALIPVDAPTVEETSVEVDAEPDDVMMNLTEMAKTMPPGVTMTITING